MKKLGLYKTTETDQLACPVTKGDQSLLTPALEFLTDFNKADPFVIDESVKAVDVKILMQQSHLKLMLVVDRKNNFKGLVTLHELNDLAFVKKTSQGRVSRDDLLISEMMVPRRSLHSLDYQELQSAQIGDVIDQMQSNGEQYTLVVERQSHKIRGVFCASRLAKQLNVSLDMEQKHSFYHIFNAITRV